MRVVPWWVWFDSKSEEREFKKILNNSQTDIEAIGNIIEKYPNLTMDQASGLVENFKKEINKNHENK
ncbi:MAG: hypothetical protein ACLSGJ_11090 [Lachnospira eligens]